jgi:hypothetical protein
MTIILPIIIIMVITAASSLPTGRLASPKEVDHKNMNNQAVEGIWRQRPIRDDEEDYNNGVGGGNSERNTGSPVVSASYYPYAMDRLDDAMSEIPFDEFYDLWKFVDDDPGDHNQMEENEAVEGSSNLPPSSVISKQHPRDLTLPSSSKLPAGIKSNKNRRKNQRTYEDAEQLIQNPKTRGIVKRVKTLSSSTPSSSLHSQNPLLAQVLGISIESVFFPDLFLLTFLISFDDVMQFLRSPTETLSLL